MNAPLLMSDKVEIRGEIDVVRARGLTRKLAEAIVEEAAA